MLPPLLPLEASIKALGLMLAASGSHWRGSRNGVAWENLGKLKTSHAIGFWTSCRMVLRDRPYRAKCSSSESTQKGLDKHMRVLCG